jgi:transcriptional regulator with XRE-family HTH domain
MPKKTKSRNNQRRPTRVDPRSVGHADIEMGRRIRERRHENGLSQTELADKLGVSFQQVQKYEKGANRVSAPRLRIVAEALGVDVKFFYDGNVNAKDVESLLFLDSAFSLRILRAYTSIKDQAVQRQFVALVELIADSQSLGASKKPPPR